MSTTESPAAAAAPAPAAAPAASPLVQSEAIQKVLSVPLVSDSIKYAQQTLASFPPAAQAAAVGGNLVNTGLRAAEPLTTRFSGQLQYVDGLAVKGLDFAKQQFPYAFEATPNQLVKDLRGAPATAKGIATAKIDDLRAHNDYAQKAIETLTALQGTLTAALIKAKDGGKAVEGEAAKEADAVSKNLLQELESVRSYVLGLPSEAASRFRPVREVFTHAYVELAKQAAEPNVPASTKFNNILKYVKEQALPALHQVIQSPRSTATTEVTEGEAATTEKETQPTSSEKEPSA